MFFVHTYLLPLSRALVDVEADEPQLSQEDLGLGARQLSSEQKCLCAPMATSTMGLSILVQIPRSFLDMVTFYKLCSQPTVLGIFCLKLEFSGRLQQVAFSCNPLGNV